MLKLPLGTFDAKMSFERSFDWFWVKMSVNQETEKTATMGKRALERAPGLPHAAAGEPLFGTYQGACESTALGRLAVRANLGMLGRVASEKRWQWFGVFDERIALGGAIVRMGYASQVFVWVFDRRARKMLVDHSLTLPSMATSVSDHPFAGRVAKVRSVAGTLEINRARGAAVIRGSFGPVTLFCDMGIDQNNPPITAICEVPDERTNITQKQAGLRASGFIEVRGKRRYLEPGAVGFLDYTHGLMAHHTSWWWAIGSGETESGREVAFNLVDGFNQGRENVLWIDGEPFGVSHARFERGEGARPWRVSTRDGVLDLEMLPEGARSEDVVIGPLCSVYTQPLGAWRGQVDGEALVFGVGVAEEHVAKW